MDGKMGSSVRRKEDYRLLRGQGEFPMTIVVIIRRMRRWFVLRMHMPE